MKLSIYAQPKLKPGYAETSTRRRPAQPTTVMVTESDCAACQYNGEAQIDGRAGWQRFKVIGQRRYYFQFNPW